MYINVRQQELVPYKKIGYEFYCEDHFVARHKSIYSCKSAIYLDKSIIKWSCDIMFCNNKTDITPTMMEVIR